jgi:flagellar assembly protein FliH
LQEEMLRKSRESFEQVLKHARAEVAEDLERMRQATLAQAVQEGLTLGRQQGTQQGYEVGYEQGYAEAKAVLEAEFESKNSAWELERDALKQSLTQEWQALVLSLTQSLSHVESSLLQDIVWLSGQMARRLVMAELTLNPDHISTLIRQVVEGLPHIVYPLTIRLHPEDVALVDVLSISQEGRVLLQPDSTLERAACVVKSGHSEVVLNWQQQTQKVIDAALQALLASEWNCT